MRRSNFALRLRPPLLEGGRKLAEAEGVVPNQQFINVMLSPPFYAPAGRPRARLA